MQQFELLLIISVPAEQAKTCRLAGIENGRLHLPKNANQPKEEDYEIGRVSNWAENFPLVMVGVVING